MAQAVDTDAVCPMPSSATCKVAGKAAIRAFAFGMLLYVIAIHICMVFTGGPVPKSETESPVLALINSTGMEAAMTEPVHVINVKKKKEKQIIPADVIEDLKNEWAHAKGKQSRRVAVLVKSLKLLSHNANQLSNRKPPKRKEPDASVSNELKALDNLLWFESLNDLYDQELDDSFDEAMNELDLAISNPQSVAWETANLIWFAKYPRKKAKKEEKVCPTESDQLEDNRARKSDILSRVEQIESALKERSERSKTEALFPPLWTSDNIDRTLQKLKEVTEQASLNQRTKIDTIVEDIQKKKRKAYDAERSTSKNEKEIESEDTNCINSDDVKWIVDEALDALFRKQDLRGSLERSLTDLDPDAGANIILDAMLPSIKRAPLQVSEKINLRQIIDTPLVSHQSPQWIDYTVDQLDGYFDIFDEALDNILKKGGSESLGQLAVTTLLHLAGKISIPNVYSSLPRNSGMLRP